jgi:hypothetical protein
VLGGQSKIPDGGCEKEESGKSQLRMGKIKPENEDRGSNAKNQQEYRLSRSAFLKLGTPGLRTEEGKVVGLIGALLMKLNDSFDRGQTDGQERLNMDLSDGFLSLG